MLSALRDRLRCIRDDQVRTPWRAVSAHAMPAYLSRQKAKVDQNDRFTLCDDVHDRVRAVLSLPTKAAAASTRGE